MPNFHFYTLKPKPYNAMEEGYKTIEMRLDDEKRRSLSIGDFIIFTHTEDKNKSLLTVIKDLKHYCSFKELYEDTPNKLDLGYLEDETPHYEDMYDYYPKERIDKYHVLAIHLNHIHFFKVNDKNHEDYDDLQEILGFDYLDNCLIIKNYNYLDGDEEYKLSLDEFIKLYEKTSLISEFEAKNEIEEREQRFNKTLEEITSWVNKEKDLVEKQKYLHFTSLNCPFKKNQEVRMKRKVDIAKKDDKFFLDDVMKKDDKLYYSLKVVSDKKNRGIYILGTDYIYTSNDFEIIENKFIKDEYYVGRVIINKNINIYI